MAMRKPQAILITFVVILAAVITGWLAHVPKAKAPTKSTANSNGSPKSDQVQIFSTADIPDRDPHLEFRISLPVNLAGDYLASAKSLRFYVPGANGQTPDIQLLAWYGSTLPAGTITQYAGPYVDGMLSAWYAGVTGSASSGLPSWVAHQHNEAWVSIQGNANHYYVFAQGPSLSDAAFQTIVTSLRFDQALPTTNTQLN